MSKSPHIVIVGGGFGGVFTAKRLLSYGYRVTLINERNYFIFTPMLHEVATGGLSARDIIFDYQSFFKSSAFAFIRGRATSVDFDARSVQVDDTKISGDYLVLATGSITNTHALKGAEQAYMLKTIDDAQAIKQKIISLVQGPQQKIAVNVIGAGPTGVELVFELEQFICELKKLNPNVNCTIRLIHHSDHILSSFPESIQKYTKQLLQKSNITVLANTTVQSITSDTITTEHDTFASDMTVIASGVRPNTACVAPTLLAEKKHITVLPNLQIQGQHNCFALGDIIMIDTTAMPKLAQAATDQAEIVAKNIHRLELGRDDLVVYIPKLRGLLLSLGFRQGAGSVHGITITGIFAWWLWRTVYLFKIPGLQNKLRVAFSWTLNLFTKRSLVEE